MSTAKENRRRERDMAARREASEQRKRLNDMLHLHTTWRLKAGGWERLDKKGENNDDK